MDILAEIIVDLVVELHSILRTRLPDKWDFVKLYHNKSLSVILNNITYFTVYIFFLVWFVKSFISRVQDASGRRLGAKDKCLVAVISMVSAMHLLWPFLLFMTYFLTCGFYPWATAAIVILLNISYIKNSLKMLCLNIYSKTSLGKDYIIRVVSFRATSEPATDHTSSEGGSHPPTEGDNTRPCATPVKYSGLLVDDGYKSSERPAIQPGITPEDHPGPSQTPTIQPKIVAEEQYRSLYRPRIPPRIEPDNQPGPSETHIMQPKLPAEEQYRSPYRPRIQPRIEPKKQPGPSQTPTIQPKLPVQEPYRPSDRPNIQPWIEPDNQPGPSQTPTIQPRIVPDNQPGPSQTPTIQSQIVTDNELGLSDTPEVRVVPEKTHGTYETHLTRHGNTSTPYRPAKESKLQPRALVYESESEETEISGESEDSESETITGYSIHSGKTSTNQRPRNNKYGDKSNFWELEYEMVDDLIPYKSFKEQMGLNKTRVKTSTPRKNRGKESTEEGKEDTMWSSQLQSSHQGVQKSHKNTYCTRCWKIVNHSFRSEFSTSVEPHRTRLGTIYGPPNIFCQCPNFLKSMEY